MRTPNILSLGASMVLEQNLLPTPLNDAQWNDKFALWCRPPTDSEEARIQRAARIIKQVLATDAWLRHQGIEVIPQGSYRNNTNVRMNCDMDLCVRHPFVRWAVHSGSGLTLADLGLIPVPGTIDQAVTTVKEHVFQTLQTQLGVDQVEWGNKSLKVKEVAGSRVDTDVVPAMNYWWAWRGSTLLTSSVSIVKGVAIRSDEGQWIYNFPDQHYERGKAKNIRTGRRYKRVVRILKCLRDEMAAAPEVLAHPPSSFLIESLVYNCPDELLQGKDWYETIWRVLAWVYNVTSKPTVAGALVEANGIKPLFVGGQPWTVQQANSFALAASLKIS